MKSAEVIPEDTQDKEGYSNEPRPELIKKGVWNPEETKGTDEEQKGGKTEADKVSISSMQVQNNPLYYGDEHDNDTMLRL